MKKSDWQLMRTWKCLRTKMHHFIYLLLCGFFAALLLCGCGLSKAPASRSGFYFDTIIQITIYDAGKENCLDECLNLAKKYEEMLSPTLEGSDIYKINHSGGKPVTVSPETATLLTAALSYCDISAGRIDLTMETVSRLWDFHEDDALANGLTGNRLPDEAALADALRHVDYHHILIENNTVTLLDSESTISLGFIAKGYIADKMKEYLLSQNVKSAIINLGGNLIAIGQKPDGTPFRFGIQTPFDKHGTPITVLSVSGQSVVSSGVYERYFYQDDVLYHHILDTKDGYPVQNNLLSVTILSDSSTMGDALSTTCFVLGLEEGMALVESLDGVEAVFITDDYCLHYSSGLSHLNHLP